MQEPADLSISAEGDGRAAAAPFLCGSHLVTGLKAFDTQPLSFEPVCRVKGARVIWADAGALAADYGALFPCLASGSWDGADLQAWLVGAGAIVSQSQACQCDVNDLIPVYEETAGSFRPPRYGRAAIVAPPEPKGFAGKAGPLPFIDVKGCGVPNDEVPVLPNSNGLLTLRDAVFEIVMQKLVAAVLASEGRSETVLPNYALLDLGFYARFQGGRRDEKATVLLRRAQTRPAWQWGDEDPGRRHSARLLAFECILRRHGLSASTCGAVRFRLERHDSRLVLTRDGGVIPLSEERLSVLARIGGLRDDGGNGCTVFDGVNVQISDGLDEEPERFQVMDFGRYRFVDAFDQVLYSWSARDYLALEGVFSRPPEREGEKHPDLLADYEQPMMRASLASIPQSAAYRDLWRCVSHYEAGAMPFSAMVQAIDRVEKTAKRLLGSGP